jgi:hypothetical protein
MTIGRFTYTRNLDTGHVGIDTGFGGADTICVDGVWHDRARWVPATHDEWKAAHTAPTGDEFAEWFEAGGHP